jgi:hypothetical protein
MQATMLRIIPGSSRRDGFLVGSGLRLHSARERHRTEATAVAVRKDRLFIPGVGQSQLDYFEKVVGIEGFN